MGLLQGLRKLKAFFYFSFLGWGLVLLPTKVGHAQVEYSQTVQGPQFVLPCPFPSIINIMPDPNAAVDDSLLLYQALPVGIDSCFNDNGGGGGDGGGFIPLTTLQRNPDLNTWSQTIVIHRDSTGLIPALPAFANGDIITFAIPQDPNLTLEAAPSNVYNIPTGSALFSVTLPDAIPNVIFTQAFGCNPPAADLQNFILGFTRDSPINNSAFASGPFPTVNDPPATLVAGSVNPGPYNVNPPSSAVNDQLAFFGVTVDLSSGTPTVGKIPLMTYFDLGAATNPQEAGDPNSCPAGDPNLPEGPLAATTPLLADFNGDGCTDLVIRVDIDEDVYDDFVPPVNPPQDFLARFTGDCSGTLTKLSNVPLGSNLGYFDIAAGDLVGNDGLLELFQTFPVSGNTLPLGPGFAQIIQDPLGAFNEVSQPSLPANMRPTFADTGDCDGDGSPDIFLAGIDLEVDATGEPTKLNSTDVICLINGQTQGLTIYPASKLNFNPPLPPDPTSGNVAATLISSTAVGEIGCGTGWTGVQYFVPPGTEPPVLGQILIAERSDCVTFVGKGASTGDGFGACMQGSGCAISLIPETKEAEGRNLYWLLFLLPLSIYAGYLLIKLREKPIK